MKRLTLGAVTTNPSAPSATPLSTKGQHWFLLDVHVPARVAQTPAATVSVPTKDDVASPPKSLSGVIEIDNRDYGVKDVGHLSNSQFLLRI